MLPDHHRCAYLASSIRCGGLATMSESTKGEGPWYCRGHWRERGTKTADQWAEYLARHGEPVAEDWRDTECNKRRKELDLPTNMTREESWETLDGDFGDLVRKQIERGRAERARNALKATQNRQE